MVINMLPKVYVLIYKKLSCSLLLNIRIGIQDVITMNILISYE